MYTIAVSLLIVSIMGFIYILIEGLIKFLDKKLFKGRLVEWIANLFKE